MDDIFRSTSDLADVFSHLEAADPETLRRVQIAIDRLIVEKQTALARVNRSQN